MARDATERLLFEQRLADSEQRYRRTVEALGDGLIVVDGRGCVTLMNPSAARIFGRTAGDAAASVPVARLWQDAVDASGSLLTPGQLPCERARLTGQEQADSVIGIPSPHGGVRWLAVRTRPITSDENGFHSVVLSISDITELRRTTQELQQSETRLAAAQRIAHVGSWTWDIRQGSLEWSDETYRIFGLGRDGTTPTYELFLQSIHPDDREMVESAVRRCLDSGGTYDVTHRIVLPDGETRIVRERGEVLAAGAGPVLMHGTVQDVTEQTLADERLRTLSAAIEQTADAVLITDIDGVIRYVNPAFERTTGFSAHDALGRTPSILKSGRTPPEVYRELWQTILQGRVYTAVLENRRRNGQFYFAEKTITPIRDATGSIVSFVSIDKDITAGRRVTEAFRGIASASADSSIDLLVDLPRLTAMSVDASLAVLAELPPAAPPVIVATWTDPSESALAGWRPGDELLRLPSGTVLATGDPQLLQLDPGTVLTSAGMSVLCARGPLIAGRGHAVLLLVGRGLERVETDQAMLQVFVGRFAVELERRQTLAALKASEERFRSLINGLNYGVFSVAADGAITGANPEFLRMLEIPHDFVEQARFQDLWPFPDQAEAVLSDMRGEGGLRELECEWIVNGRPLAVILSGRAFTDESGVFSHFDMIAVDVTERRAMERRLQQAQKMEAIGRLSGGIAHDFNNLLTVIQFNTELMLLEVPEGDTKLRKRLSVLQQTSLRGSSMVRKLLAFSRKDHLAARPVALGALLQDLLTIIRPAVPEWIGIEMDITDDLPAVMADPGAVEQVVLNLVTNARDAMPRGGLLFIRAERLLVDASTDLPTYVPDGEFVRVTVRDDGIGMSPETVARAFEPFFSTKGIGAGTGLGLAMVYGLMKQHRGFVLLRSTPGAGTTVDLLFPAATPVSDERTDTPVNMASGGETILVVEDEEEIRTTLRDLLVAHGYSVLTASHGLEAVLIAAQHAPDIALIISDVIMPHMDGHTMVQRLRSMSIAVPVLLLTGYGYRDEDAVLPDRVHIMGKAGPTAELLGLIRKLLRGESTQ